ncbi:MAG: 50S ribosomal protein L1 [Candidatus Omnitrophota bacterium]
MKKPSKRMKQVATLVDKNKVYLLEEAIDVLKNSPSPKFDESVDISMDLGIDPKQTTQMVRGTVILPHGTGKKIRVLCFCKGESENFAKEAGADHIGGLELVEKVAQGFSDFDVAVSTPDMMRDVGRLGKVLGPKGLMPNPKSGTVTDDVAKAIKEAKAGKVEFKMDKLANINGSVGKISFDKKAIIENASIFIAAILHARPASLKGQYIRSVSISTTMGPGLRLDISGIAS